MKIAQSPDDALTLLRLVIADVASCDMSGQLRARIGKHLHENGGLVARTPTAAERKAAELNADPSFRGTARAVGADTISVKPLEHGLRGHKAEECEKALSWSTASGHPPGQVERADLAALLAEVDECLPVAMPMTLTAAGDVVEYGPEVRPGVRARLTLDDLAALAMLVPRLRDALVEAHRWEDGPDEWSEAIGAAFPTRSGSHEHYATAMRMVRSRYSKGALVALVNWLLVTREVRT